MAIEKNDFCEADMPFKLKCQRDNTVSSNF